MREKLAHADAHRRAGRFEEARQLFIELYAATPDDAQVNYHYAWMHDNLGEESAAVPLYVRAIELGLPETDLRNAFLGLGSTYRTLGEYDKALATLKQGTDRFPDAHEFGIFSAMALHNLGCHAEAMELLLTYIGTASTTDEWIRRYQRGILFYADKLDQVW